MAQDPEMLTAALAHTLTPAPAFAKALDHEVYYDRGNDVSKVMEAALSYATETMSEAIGTLAFLAKEMPVVSAAGHRIQAVPGPSAQAIDLLLTQDGQPGGRLVTVHYAPVLHDKGKAAVAAIKAEMEAEMDALGVTGHARIFAEMGIGKQTLQTAQKLKAYKASGAGYRPAEPGDPVKVIRSTALDMGTGRLVPGVFGVPREIEAEDTLAVAKALPVKAHPDGWWPGIDFEVRPALRAHDDGALMPASRRTGPGFPETFAALSEIIRDSGLAHLVSEKDAVISHTPWHTTGVGYFQDLEEAGYAAVHASGGFFDAAAGAHIRQFSADISAQDVAKNIDEWVRTARGLADRGFGSGSATFDCNDMRDMAFAEVTADGVAFHTRTQHGEYRVDVALGPDDGVLAVRACRCGGQDRDVGRFVMTAAGLRADYGATPEAEAIAYTIRNVRDMNGIIASLSSVACVFCDTYPEADDAGMRP